MIETDRLILRNLIEEDTDFCFSIWLDEEMGKYLGDPPREKASESYLNFAKDIQSQEDWFPFIIVEKETNKSIGTISYVPNDNVWDFGYTIHRDYWRQGFAKETVEGLINYANSLGINCFTADVAQENIASNKLMQSLNFLVESEGSFKKSGTEIVYSSFTYRLCTTEK